MGRKKSNAVYRYYDLNENEKMSMCKLCGKQLKTQHGANLLKHLKHLHSEQFQLASEINNSIAVQNTDEHETTFDQILLECTNLIAIHGRPFALIDDTAFQNLIKMIPNNTKAINSKKIRNNVESMATDLRTEISKKLLNKIICLKVDIASIGTRFFLGINCQFIEEGQIILMNLAVTEIYQRHTSEHLKDLLLYTLQRFRIDTKQIYCITTDNGANMLKMSKLLNEVQQLACNESEAGPSSSQPINNDDNDSESDSDILQDTLTEENETEAFTTGIIGELQLQFANNSDRPDEGLQNPIGIVRCAAHTLQLAMQDASNYLGTRVILSECREVVRRLRTPQFVRILKEQKKSIPKLDCTTRWHSTIDMVESLLSLKDICDANERLQLSSTSWSALEDFVKSMAPAKILTKKLQEEQLTAGNFYIEWMLCQYKLRKIGTELAINLINKMEERQKVLLDNDIVINAMCLDPRVNSTLSPEQLTRAKNNLINLFFRYYTIEPLHSTDNIVTETSNNQNETMEARKDMEDFLNSCYINRQDNLNILLVRRSDPHGQIKNNLEQAFTLFFDEPLLKSTDDVLIYWEKSKLKFPLLYKLSTVVLAAPMTQVSVERLFSSLKFIVSNYRISMKDNIIDDLLFLRSNDIFKRN